MIERVGLPDPADAERVETDFVAFRNGMVHAFDVGRSRAEHRDVAAGDQLGDATDMVCMVMGQQDRAKIQPLRREAVFDDCRITRVDDCCKLAATHQPQVVIPERRERDNFDAADF